MHRYLLEVALPEAIAPERITASVRSIGSHFASHADWRLTDGLCTGSMIVETADEQDALAIVPPGMRAAAHIHRLERRTAGLRKRQVTARMNPSVSNGSLGSQAPAEGRSPLRGIGAP